AIERSVAANRDGLRLRAERGQHPSKDTVTFLPVCARDVKRQIRFLAVLRPALHFDIRRFGRDVTRLDLDPVRPIRVNELAPDRNGIDRRQRAEWTGIKTAVRARSNPIE